MVTGLKKQGANNGAALSFMIATPESGVDSIAISWAMLDPIMTLIRPVAAFVTAVSAGVAENLFNSPPVLRPSRDPVHGSVPKKPGSGGP